VQGLEDLLVRLAGEQLDLPGGQAGLGIKGGEQLRGERHGNGEAGGDAAGPGSRGTQCRRSTALISGSA